MAWKLYLGLIARWPATGRANWRDYEHIFVSMNDIINIIPWDDVPTSLQESVWDRWRPHVGVARHLVLLTDGRAIPSPRGKDLLKDWKHKRQTSRSRSFVPRDQQLIAELQSAGWVTIAEAAKATGYCPDHLRLLCRENEIPAQKLNWKWWLHLKSLKSYQEK